MNEILFVCISKTYLVIVKHYSTCIIREMRIVTVTVWKADPKCQNMHYQATLCQSER